MQLFKAKQTFQGKADITMTLIPFYVILVMLSIITLSIYILCIYTKNFQFIHAI